VARHNHQLHHVRHKRADGLWPSGVAGSFWTFHSTPVTPRASELEGQHCREQVHWPVHDDHPRETARPQIDELKDHDQWQKLQEAKYDQTPVEQQREHAVLERPPETYQRYRDPHTASQDLQASRTIGLVEDFLGRRPD
jgi:hypothetical protein